MTNNKLTGKARYATLVITEGREQEAFLILEVEEEWEVMDSIGGSIEFRTYTRWRKASVRDLTQMEIEL